MAGSDGNIVEKAEAHGLCPLGMMSRGTDGTKCGLRLPAHHQVSRMAACTRRT